MFVQDPDSKEIFDYNPPYSRSLGVLDPETFKARYPNRRLLSKGFLVKAAKAAADRQAAHRAQRHQQARERIMAASKAASARKV